MTLVKWLYRSVFGVAPAIVQWAHCVVWRIRSNGVRRTGSRLTTNNCPAPVQVTSDSTQGYQSYQFVEPQGRKGQQSYSTYLTEQLLFKLVTILGCPQIHRTTPGDLFWYVTISQGANLQLVNMFIKLYTKLVAIHFSLKFIGGNTHALAFRCFSTFKYIVTCVEDQTKVQNGGKDATCYPKAITSSPADSPRELSPYYWSHPLSDRDITPFFPPYQKNSRQHLS